MTNEWLAWAAGIVDGEGCIALVKGRHRRCKEYYALRVAVTNTDPRMLLQLRHTLGGAITKHGVIKVAGHKRVWRWSATGRIAAEMLQKMLPWLVTKRDQAELAISFRQCLRRRGKPDESLLIQQRAIYTGLSQMKRTTMPLEHVGQNIPLAVQGERYDGLVN